jgi:hypothetical protein
MVVGAAPALHAQLEPVLREAAARAGEDATTAAQAAL